MKKFILIICVLCISLAFTACTNDSDINIFTPNTSTQETDYEIITKFYDSIAHLKEATDTLSYTSLKNEVDTVLAVINEFEEQASKSNSDYSTYYEEILDNMWYVGFKNNYAIDDPNIENALSDSLFASTHAYIISEYMTEILEVELPFEYSIEDNNLETEAADNKRIEYINNAIEAAIDNGTNIYLTPYNYTQLSKTINHTFNDSKIEFDLIINFNKTPEHRLCLWVTDYNMLSPAFDKITSFVLTDSINTVTLNSNYEEYTGPGFSTIYFYDTSFSSAKNEKYKEIKELFYNAKTLSVIINDDITLELTTEEIESFKQNFILFDEIKKICDFKQN